MIVYYVRIWPLQYLYTACALILYKFVYYTCKNTQKRQETNVQIKYH
jgi:hypothetical protein